MISLAHLTMNAGDDISGSCLKHSIKNFADKFNKLYIVDGHLTDNAKKFYKKHKNVDIIDSPWKDSYVNQYEAFVAKLNHNEWVLYLDDDELPSDNLMKFIQSHDFNSHDGNMFYIPCQLHITENGKDYYCVEEYPLEKFKGQWTKHILFKKHFDLNFKYFGSHVIPTFGKFEKPQYIPFPYYHLKSLESFVYNDVWQAFLCPEGQGYDELEASQFKMLTKHIKDGKMFKDITMNHKWAYPLQKFAWNKRWKTNSPISRLAWVYFLFQDNKFLEKDEKFAWNNIKIHVLGKEKMNLFEQNKATDMKISVEK